MAPFWMPPGDRCAPEKSTAIASVPYYYRAKSCARPRSAQVGLVREVVDREAGGSMREALIRLCFAVLAGATMTQSVWAQKSLTWQEIRDRFEAGNPTLRAGQIGVDESRAQEITAFLRPNPSLSLLADQINPFSGGPPHSTFGSLLTVAAANYLHERQHKRELRLESAQKATGI